MPKVRRPQIAGPTYDDRDEAPPPRAASHAPAYGSGRRARDVPYSVAWFRDRIATYALGTIICGALMLTIAAWMGGQLGAFGQRMNNGFNVIAGWAGMAVQKVTVSDGLEPAVEARVLEAAQVAPGHNILMADPYAIRDRIEKLDVGAVSVQRLWPDRIDIHVDQREAVALWQEHENGGAWRVVDQSGRAFAEADMTRYGDLPHVVGQNAAQAAVGLVSAMKAFPGLAERFEVAYRIGDRRWDVKFAGRADVVVLPADENLVSALECVNLQHAQTGLLDLPATRIDARNGCTLAIQPIPGAPSPGALSGDA
jgi:cell division protein FtsQ